MLHCAALAGTEVSEERIVSIIKNQQARKNVSSNYQQKQAAKK
jgi:hypothetical protein